MKKYCYFRRGGKDILVSYRVLPLYTREQDAMYGGVLTQATPDPPYTEDPDVIRQCRLHWIGLLTGAIHEIPNCKECGADRDEIIEELARRTRAAEKAANAYALAMDVLLRHMADAVRADDPGPANSA